MCDIKMVTAVMLMLGPNIGMTAQAQGSCGALSPPKITAKIIIQQSDTTGSITIAWTGVASATYAVRYGLQGARPEQACSGTGLMSCTVNGLTPGNLYNFSIEASRPCRQKSEEPDTDEPPPVMTTVMLPALFPPTGLVIVKAKAIAGTKVNPGVP